MKNEDRIVELLSGMLKKQDHHSEVLTALLKKQDYHSEVLTALVQRMDSKEVADQRRFEAIEGELKENNRILTSVAHVVSSLVINHQAAYVELSDKIRRLEEKVYGQAS